MANSNVSTILGIDFVSDPETKNGRVSRESMPVERAKDLVPQLEAVGLSTSWAPDSEDASQAWLYIVSAPAASIQPALDKLDGQVYVDDAGDIAGLVYFADETRRYYAVDLNQIESLAARIAAGESDAYSLWCASEGYAGDGFETEEEAAIDAELVSS